MCADQPRIDHNDTDDSPEQQPNTVVPFARGVDSAGVTVHIDHIETTSMTSEQYRLAVTALAELINHWKHDQQDPSNAADDAA